MLVERVCIVGAGLMGGSLALALRPYIAHLTLVDTHPKTLQAAQNLADVTTSNFAVGVRDADLIILATPVRVILKLLAELPNLRPDGCLVMDLGSTKMDICQMMGNLPSSFQAIGGHPMCGKETAGFAAADPDFYQGETFVLCENGRTTTHITAVAQQIIDKIGAQSLHLLPEKHDQMVAATSHLPYLLSAALMQNAASQNDDQLWLVSASGFRDTTRLAGSDPKMMLDILLTNKTAVINQINSYQTHLNQLKQLLQSSDDMALTDWLTETQRQHLAYKNVKRKM